MIRKFLVAGLTACLLLGAVPGALAADAKLEPSSAVRKNLVAAQTANNKKDFPAALVAIEAAKQVADRTPHDNYLINRFAASIYVGMKDLTAATPAAEAAADTDPAAIPEAEKAAIYNLAMQLAMNAKHFDKAAKYGKALMALTPPPNSTDMSLIARANFFNQDYPGAIEVSQKNIDAAIAAGQKPQRGDFQVLMSAQAQMKDDAGAQKTLEQAVATFNQPEDWDRIVPIAFTTPGMRDIDYIHMGRLMFQLGGKIRPEDASLIGATANKLGLLGDTQQAEKAGGTGFTPVGTRADADKKTIPAQIAAGAKENGNYNVKLAEALYGYGMYPQAIAAAQLGKSKGGAADPTEADMVIGMSQAASDKYSEAVTTFGAIRAPNPAAARVVRLWTIFAKSKANPTTAAN
ncbi:MAG TPA: hypothetical protein VJL82_00435 [Rhizomicrobium sp.]|nr:hypothetical protein [Rhizomicrobium sp.]